jgi:hypothetical protein
MRARMKRSGLLRSHHQQRRFGYASDAGTGNISGFALRRRCGAAAISSQLDSAVRA